MIRNSSAVNNINSRWPEFVCVLTTAIAIPIWFAMLVSIAHAFQPFDNPVGIPLYFVLCLISAIPVGFINAFFIAPKIAKLLKKTSNYCIPLLLNGIVFLGAAVAIACWWYTLTLGIGVFWFTVLFWYMSLSVIPPIVMGSIVYSFCYLASLKQFL